MDRLIVLSLPWLFCGVLHALAKLAHWMFAPLGRRVNELTPVRRFLVVDALALMVMLQCTLAAATSLLRTVEIRRPVLAAWGLAIFVLTALVWWAGVELISRAGVSEGRRRFCFLVAGVPSIFVTSIVTCFGIPVLFLIAFAAATPWPPLLALLLLPLPPLCRRFIEWIASAPAG